MRPTTIMELHQEAYDSIVGTTATELPFEVGGILLGYIEHRCIQVTHALHVPTQTRSRDRYVRDDTQAQELLRRFLEGRDQHDTVGYIGEWHSHPSSVGPSSIDKEAIRATAAAAGTETALIVFAPWSDAQFHGLIAKPRGSWRTTRVASVRVPRRSVAPLGPLPEHAIRLDGPVFISYRQSDGTTRADEIERLLHAAGLAVWRDKPDLLPGNTEDRLEEALTSGLSAAVLVVTPDIVKSTVVRQRELPRLLELAASRDFSLAIANEIPNAADDTRPSFRAADVLLGTAPRDVIGAMKHSDSRNLDGRLELIGNLLLHRARQLAPLVSNRPFHVTTQSRVLPSSIDAGRSDLDIRIVPAEAGKLPTAQGLHDLRVTLPLVSDAIRATGATTVRISGGMHLSIALALGAALPETKFGRMEALDLEQDVWASTNCSDDPGTRHVASTAVHVGAASGRPRLAVFVHLTDGSDEAAFGALLDEPEPGFTAAISLTLTGDGRIDPRQSGRIARELADSIRSAARAAGATEVHLAYHGPFTMAVLLGRLLNTLRTVVYEWERAEDGTSRYTRTMTLELDVAKAPIVHTHL